MVGSSIVVLSFIVCLMFGAQVSAQHKFEETNFRNNTLECQPCRAGNYSDANICTSCNPGNCLPGSCSMCSPGSFSDMEGATNCTVCENGYYANAPSSKGCEPCPAGSISSDERNICKACAAGSICPNEGCQSCVLCEVGQYQDIIGQSGCKLCDYGYFSEIMGANICEPCNVGQYTLKQGSTSRSNCLQCPVGYYCPERTASPQPCPSNAYCPEGSSSAILCPSLNFPNTDNSGCSPSLTMIVLVVVGSILLVGFIISSYVVYRRSKFEKGVQEEATKLISRNEKTPVYSGL